MHLFDPIAMGNERERQEIERDNDRAIKELERLEHDLQRDENDDVEKRALDHHRAALRTVENALATTFEALESHGKLLDAASIECEALVAMLEWALEFSAAVLMHDKEEESLDWARENLRGDWHSFSYTQERYNPPITKRVFLFADDVDRINFKLRWA